VIFADFFQKWVRVFSHQRGPIAQATNDGQTVQNLITPLAQRLVRGGRNGGESESLKFQISNIVAMRL
jgi:hypothetical protein